VAPGLAEEQLERVRRRLDGRGGDGSALHRGRLHDLDAPLVELADERLLLEPVELVGLDDLVDVGRADRAGLLAGLEQRPELILGEQGLDVDGRHGAGRGDAPCDALSPRFPQMGCVSQPLRGGIDPGACADPP
jgi:hypothetical protein